MPRPGGHRSARIRLGFMSELWMHNLGKPGAKGLQQGFMSAPEFRLLFPCREEGSISGKFHLKSQSSKAAGRYPGYLLLWAEVPGALPLPRPGPDPSNQLGLSH